MTTKLNRIVFLFLAFVIQFVFAQEIAITGIVFDETGPLAGVNIVIEGTDTGTQTDLNGNYAIDTKVGDVLSYSFVGMTTLSRIVGEDNVINVTMVAIYNTLDEVVITGVAGATSKNLRICRTHPL